jgi:hypothetical protein
MAHNIEMAIAKLMASDTKLVNCSYNHGHYVALEEDNYRCLQPCRDQRYVCSHVERLNMQRESLELQRQILEAVGASARR